MTNKEHAQLKQHLLERHFGKYREMWADECRDDRALIAGIYDQLMEAAKAMETVENNYIWVAFTRSFRADERTMCDIIKHFTGRYPVIGSGEFEHEYYPEIH